jgi:hypothetical protein
VPSVEELKLHLSTAAHETEQAAIAIRGVADRIEEALTRLRLTAIGTVHPSLTDAISRLEQARVRLDEAQTLARGAIDATNTYRALA